MKLKNDAIASRRQFVGGMTAGLAAAFVPPTLGQQGQQERGPAGSLQGPSQSRKKDPTTQYPSTPFPPQKQPPPGLAGKMIPGLIMAKQPTRAQAGWWVERHL
jgi:hypothetical protein